ncbi:proliferating cell nuclear antigen-like [Silene latifolia]|uniref:proliferating cell nuclear antigen-like n=1 Tax=Silene latifolia TaxID=37657 RepID=UPI003D7844C7
MFELRLVQGNLLKKVIEAIKDLVNEANFDCSSTGFSLQAMDSSHVALVALLLRSEGFEHFRCDRSFSMGMSIANMSKLLKCASPDDIITLKADDGTDTVTFMFESPSQNKISDIEMKLMDIDSDHLGIPEAEYDAIVRMPSSDFATLCSHFVTIGDTVTITVSKEGVTFSTRGDIGSGNTTFRQNTSTEKPEDAVIVEMKEPVVLTFALKYMTTFAKATSLSSQVTISLSSDMPVVVEYKIAEMGHIRYYLAPKIEEEDLETNTQPETTTRRETRTEPQEEAMPLAITGTKEENGVEDEVVEDSQVKMETETEAGVKPKVEKRSVKAEVIAVEDECMMETEFGEEIKSELEAAESKAEIEVMEIQ